MEILRKPLNFATKKPFCILMVICFIRTQSQTYICKAFFIIALLTAAYHQQKVETFCCDSRLLQNFYNNIKSYINSRTRAFYLVGIATY